MNENDGAYEAGKGSEKMRVVKKKGREIAEGRERRPMHHVSVKCEEFAKGCQKRPVGVSKA